MRCRPIRMRCLPLVAIAGALFARFAEVRAGADGATTGAPAVGVLRGVAFGAAAGAGAIVGVGGSSALLAVLGSDRNVLSEAMSTGDR